VSSDKTGGKARSKPGGKAGKAASTPSGPSAWDRVRPAAFRDARFHPYRIGAVAVGLAVAVSAATYIGNEGGGGSTTAAPRPTSTTPSAPAPQPTRSQTPGEQWRAGVLLDYQPLNGTIITYQQVIQAWQKGTASDTDLQGIFELGEVNFKDTRDRLQAREPFAQAPQSLENFRLSAQIFLESARIGQTAITVPAGSLRDQLRNQVDRLRNLADRVYDQAEVELAPFVPDPFDNPDVVLLPPPAVPDFAFQGIAVGAPLDTPTPKPAEQRGFIKDEDKPFQPFAQWAAAVRASGVPSADALARGITSGSGEQLRALARSYTASADRLYTTADPRGERTDSTRVQLGLLVDAEAARTAQAATLLQGVPQAALRTSAQRLALLGDQLWDRRLGARDTGFPASLLRDA